MNKITYELTIYPFQIDFMHHVSNIVYVQWMEIGRCLLLEAVGMPVAQIAEQGFGPVLVESEIQYKKPLILSDSVRAEIWISELAAASAWMEFRFYNQAGELAATGRQRGVFVTIATGRPRKLDSEARKYFEAYVLTPSSETESV
jgi:acyl-CoA thioester hydrolase